MLPTTAYLFKIGHPMPLYDYEDEIRELPEKVSRSRKARGQGRPARRSRRTWLLFFVMFAVGTAAFFFLGDEFYGRF